MAIGTREFSVVARHSRCVFRSRKMFSFDRQSKVLKGIDIPPFYHPQTTIGQVLMNYLQREPTKIVQSCYDTGVDLTAGEMAKLASRIAKNLLKEGFKLGDVVGLVAKNTTYVAPLVLACLLTGCPISTLDPTFDVGEVAHIFKQTKPKLVFCDHDNYEVVSEALKRCANESEVLTIDEEIEGVRHVAELLEAQSGEREFIPHSFGIDGSSLISVILCSSGTTGMSKGTMLSSDQCLQMAQAFPQMIGPAMLCFSSLYWLSGFNLLIYSLGNVCRRVITKRKFSPLLFVHLIEQYRVNIVLTPPSQVAMLVQSPVYKLADLSSIRLYLVGGGFLAQHLRETLQDHLLYGALIMVYGMTEMAGIVTSTQPFQKPSNSVGKIMPNMKIKIVDEDGNTVDPSVIGEIYIMSSVRFLGYAGNPEATRNAFDRSGWLKSGDLGYLTEEGEVFIVDRKKDMIKYLNYQVAPSELETFIQKMEGVKIVCVVGIPDMIAGDLAAAVVVKEKNSFINEQDIVDEVARNFPQFKRLHGGAYFIDTLPLTPSGKVKKMLVRKKAAQMFKSNEINGNY